MANAYKYMQQMNNFDTSLQSEQLKDQAKEQLKQVKEGVGELVGVPSSEALAKNALFSQGTKNLVKRFLKTGNDDIDGKVGDIIDGINEETNPFDAGSELAKNLANQGIRMAKSKIQQAISGAQAEQTDPGDPAINGSSIVDNIPKTSEIDSTIMNRAFDPDLADPDMIARGYDGRPPAASISGKQEYFPETDEMAEPSMENLFDTSSRVLSGVRGSDIWTNSNTIPDKIVSLARANKGMSSSNRIGDLINQAKENVSSAEGPESMAAQQLQKLNSDISDPGSLVKSAADNVGDIMPADAADLVPDSIQSVADSAQTLIDGVPAAIGDAVSGISDAVSGGLAAGDTALEGIGAALDSTGILAPIGALLGLAGLGTSIGLPLADHGAGQINYKDIAIPSYNPGID